MGLIITDRHTSRDLECWRTWQRADASHDRRLGRRLDDKAERAKEAMREFIANGDGYLGISWGKDSLVLAHMMRQLEHEGIAYPSVWVRLDEVENPDCLLVRDAFISSVGLAGYHEVFAQRGSDAEGGRRTADGFKMASRRFGRRHISGVRGAESSMRAMVMNRLGVATERTCRPIGRWSTEEVFAYLYRHDLPVHPAYGYLMGGAYDRNRLRTAAIGGDRGSSHGREEWERTYYPDQHRIARGA